MFLNISNHPLAKWEQPQIAAALACEAGEIRDIAFPNVSTTATTAEVGELADKLAAQVADGDVAMVQGEFTLVHAIVNRLRRRGLRVVAAVTERIVTETVKNGALVKTNTFVFAGFRNYE